MLTDAPSWAISILHAQLKHSGLLFSDATHFVKFFEPRLAQVPRRRTDVKLLADSELEGSTTTEVRLTPYQTQFSAHSFGIREPQWRNSKTR